MSKFEYLKLADTVAAEIANGALKPGDRLPPQRSFAYERKIAVSTASRVYTELLRRGLVVGEVGRGTFVSGETRRGIAQPPDDPFGGPPGRVDISLHLGQSDRTLGQSSIGVEYGVLAVLPALVDQALIGLGAIFDESVVVAVAVPIDPVER